MPFFSQMTRVRAQVIAPAAARSRSRLIPGLRACTGLSRHSSVVSSSPCAVDVDAAAFQHHLRRERPAASSRLATNAGTAASRCQSSYFAQALKRQAVSAIFAAHDS